MRQFIPAFLAFCTKRIIGIIIKKKLGDEKIGSCLTFDFQSLDVIIQGTGFRMFFGICSSSY